ncbi:MAG TPA: TlpA disulfide reductase family protein [Acidiferrobacterales bacterium]|jgi:peroxiredoxin
MIHRALCLTVVLMLAVADAGARELKPYTGDPRPAPLSLRELNGDTRQLADFRGRVVLVNFWATWCPPCIKEMPSMQRLHERFAERGFAVLAVNMGETEAEVRAFLTRVPVSFPILLDADGVALKAWKVFAFPTSYVVDADGRIRLAVFGEVDWDAPEVIAKIEALLPADPR